MKVHYFFLHQFTIDIKKLQVELYNLHFFIAVKGVASRRTNLMSSTPTFTQRLARYAIAQYLKIEFVVRHVFALKPAKISPRTDYIEDLSFEIFQLLICQVCVDPL